MAEINNTHTIQKGNTLWGIAKKNGTTVDALLKLNPELKGQERKLQIGAKIILPGQSPSGQGTTVERTEQKPSDQLTAQKRNRTHAQEVAAMNATAVAAKNKELPKTKASKSTLDVLQIEMNRKKVPAGNPKYRSVEEWSSMIEKVSSEYGFPKEILIAHISREVTFKKNLVSKCPIYKTINVSQPDGTVKKKRVPTGKYLYQYGCMQITQSATNDMFPKDGNIWSDICKESDPKLFNDIFYKKDENGNMVKRYSNADDLLIACKNDEISIKVGALYDKMLYAKAYARKMFGNATPKNVKKAIQLLNTKQITDRQNMTNIIGMATMYNGSKTYANALGDSLEKLNYSGKRLF